MGIFSYESKFSQVLLRVAESCMLNALWALCSLPVVTMGAATSALYAVTLKLPKREEGDIARQFFRAFRANFRQATVLWLIMLAAGAFLGADVYVLLHLRAAATGVPAVLWTVVLAVVIAACVGYAMVLVYLFPLVGWVENTNAAMLRNSFFIAARYLFATVLVLAIHFAMVVVVVRLFTPAVLFGEGTCAVLSAYLLRPVIDLCTAPAGAALPERADDTGDDAGGAA